MDVTLNQNPSFLQIPLFPFIVSGIPLHTTDSQLMKELREFLLARHIDLPAQLKSRALQNSEDASLKSQNENDLDSEIAFALASAALSSVKYDEKQNGFVGLPTNSQFYYQGTIISSNFSIENGKSVF